MEGKNFCSAVNEKFEVGSITFVCICVFLSVLGWFFYWAMIEESKVGSMTFVCNCDFLLVSGWFFCWATIEESKVGSMAFVCSCVPLLVLSWFFCWAFCNLFLNRSSFCRSWRSWDQIQLGFQGAANLEALTACMSSVYSWFAILMERLF